MALRLTHGTALQRKIGEVTGLAEADIREQLTG
jgi:hypothetical protein